MSEDNAIEDAAAKEEARLNSLLGMSALERRKKELEMRHKKASPHKWGTVEAGKGAAPAPSASPAAASNYEPTWKRLEREEKERKAAGGGQQHQQEAGGGGSSNDTYIPTWKRLEMEREQEAAWEPPAIQAKKAEEERERNEYHAAPSSRNSSHQSYLDNLKPELRSDPAPRASPAPRAQPAPRASPAPKPQQPAGARSQPASAPITRAGGSAADERTCAACGKAIPPGGTLVKADNGQYHQDCFACAHCKHPISASYNMHEGQITCDGCMDKLDRKVCHRCSQVIHRGDEFTRLESRNAYYHVACFTCFTCKKALGHAFYWEAPGEAYCEDHP